MGEVGEDEGAEAEELEGQELALPTAGGDDVGLELLDLADVRASLQKADDVPVVAGRSGQPARHTIRLLVPAAMTVDRSGRAHVVTW